MAKLMLEAAQASYTVPASGNDVLRAELDGGAGRYRLDIDGAALMVNVQWVLQVDEYQYLWAFYRVRADKGATPFAVDLDLEGSMVEVTAHFMPGTFGLRAKDGETYTVGATLEVTPPEPDDDADEDILAQFEGG